MNSDMLVWHTQSAPALALKALRESRSAVSLNSLGDEPLDEHEIAALAALRARQRRTRQPPQAKDEVKRLLRSTGKLQEKAQRVERRVRKDFRETNCVSDIPGASSRALAGHTASGVRIDRQPWPYARAFASDVEGLYEEAPPLTGLREVPSVEAHLGVPGVNIVVRRRPLEPLIKPPPPPALGSAYNNRAISTKRDEQLVRAPPQREMVILERAPPLWPKPSLDTPAPEQPQDRNLSTTDITGARPRRLVSINARHSKLT